MGADPGQNGPDLWRTGSPLLTTCKGLPSSYQRDLQEDKEALFLAHDQALTMTQIAAATLSGDPLPRRQASRTAHGSGASGDRNRRLPGG